jgi:cardiolipin synthase
VFLLAGLTDGLDGMIARLFDQKSTLGAYLDPLADKILLVSSFLLLGHLQVVPMWLVVIAVSRDVIILLGIMTLMFHDIDFDIKPTGVSKATTLLQLLTVLAAMSSTLLKLPTPVYWILYLLTAGFSIASGIHYLLKGVSLLDTRKT